MCTNIKITAKNGTICARTMEFGFKFNTNLMVFPKGQTRQSTQDWVKNDGFTYQTEYGYVVLGIDFNDLTFDGVNEKGLYFDLQYYPGYAHYTDEASADPQKTISAASAGEYALAMCENIAQVRALFSDYHFVMGLYPDVSFQLPGHYMFCDAQGESIIVEFDKTGVSVHDNVASVFTNSPSYPWHVTNLNNYVNLRYRQPDELAFGDMALRPFGQGAGMMGLPGDSTPASRFVRAAAFLHALPQQETTDDAIKEAVHILNNFDIPTNFVLPLEGESAELSDQTSYTSYADLNRLKFYWKTFNAQRVESVDVKALLASVKAPVKMSIESAGFDYDRTQELLA